MDFETKVKKLESIVEQMQTSEISLNKSFELFEEGIKLSKECNDQLTKIENKVKILLDSNKNPKTQDYKPNS